VNSEKTAEELQAESELARSMGVSPEELARIQEEAADRWKPIPDGHTPGSARQAPLPPRAAAIRRHEEVMNRLNAMSTPKAERRRLSDQY
jgi:hypothetical protein